jgi:TnpA family transposase
MAKQHLLTPSERKAFQLPPIFQPDKKAAYFEINQSIQKWLDTLNSPYRKVGFVLQWGYFRRVGRFFSSQLFHKQDILFVKQLLGLDQHKINFENYKDHRFLQDQQKIRELHGVQAFEDNEAANRLLLQETKRLVEKQVRPKMIIYHLSDLFFQKKIEVPNYQKLAEVITQALEKFEERLFLIIKENLTPSLSCILDELLPKIETVRTNGKENNYERAPLIALREIPLSARPGKIKESIAGFLEIKRIFGLTKTILELLCLSTGSLKYYAVWVCKAKMTQLTQISDPGKRYLYLIAFITHQYYCRQDLLVDTLLQSVQSALNGIDKKQSEATKNNQKEKDQATKILSTSYRNKTDLLSKIQIIIDSEILMSDEKVEQIKNIIHNDLAEPEIAICIEKLDKQISRTLNKDDYYDLLEKQSIFLQNRLSSIIKNLEFIAINSASSLLEAIDHYRSTDGNIGKSPPIEFLEEQEIARLKDDKDRLRTSLYKALLFIKIAAAIKSGEINLTYSYRYRSIDEYLINKKHWQDQREDYLARSDLAAYDSSSKILETLMNKLQINYVKTNENIAQGKNPHVSFNKNGELIVTTPKVEKIETERVASLIVEKNYISILDVLTNIDKITHFSECLEHYSVRKKIKRPSELFFYAGIIGKGCNIGLNKLTSVSKGINGNTLETVVNWYLTNDNLLAANNRIIRFINRLALPDRMKKSHGRLHTSSDGQKRNVDTDTILANFSFKYHGSGRGVSIYDFIDERHVLFHSLVMSSSEREAAYVIDGLMCNDEIKSDIHSTDTHGYTDTIFAITHLLGISFAPRLAKLKKRALYAFEKKKFYEEKGCVIVPDYTLKPELVDDNWDDILRLVATIKLKEASASQILKRLSSYAKDHPLYQGLKEFGKIIRSIFLLTYIDDLPLRQAIQKQLNKIELANKFSDAIFFDNNQEFKHGTREEQELAMSCKILLQNAVVLWNYLSLSQLLANTEDLKKRAEILGIIQNGSIMFWQHINLLGEYDFRVRSSSNESIFDLEKILALTT